MKNYLVLLLCCFFYFSCAAEYKTRISSNPPNAIILVDNEVVGITPLNIEIKDKFGATNSWSITIHKDGYESQSKIFRRGITTYGGGEPIPKRMFFTLPIQKMNPKKLSSYPNSQTTKLTEKYPKQYAVETKHKAISNSTKEDTIISKAKLKKNTNLRPINQKRKALLIGNALYRHGDALANPINDLNSIDSALNELGFVVTKYANCTQSDMKKAIDIFGDDLKSYDIALFFYAGHGIQVSGNNYLIPIDAKVKNKNDVEYECVRADRILAKMESSETNANIVILDACRDNPFERSWRRGMHDKGLAFMNAPSGSFIAYATSPGNTASNGTSSKNSPYISALLEHISTPNITIEDVFKRVRATVMKKSNNEQTPWESTSLTGDFYFKQ